MPAIRTKRQKKAVEELGLKNVQVEHIYDVDKIIEMGIMMMPALAIDEKIVSAGKVLSAEEVKEILKNKLDK